MPPTFEQSKDAIAQLVKQFEGSKHQYLDRGHKEAHTRQFLIDPLFVALGWDVHNQQGLSPDESEVFFEGTQEIEGQKKAPDYVFRKDRKTVFFAEAKKPTVDLKGGIGPAYQLRRYAWSASLPLSLLTDFEETAIYDCRIRPAPTDKATVARVNYLTYQEYPDRWREIWDVFSREAVWSGAFEQYAQTAKAKRGTSPVDKEFLKEIEGWRDVLARNLALRNSSLSIDDLNDAVQRTIDRIIFLRMAEDRGIEDYERLKRLAQQAGGDNIYSGLVTLFRHADARYNSGLFDFSKQGDTLTPGLKIDDKTLKPILTSLYFPESPYEFSVLPVEILGNVYEQFLGKVIRLTSGHQAKVEEKPEVRKAGGVYYTLAYIVECIVKNTVGVAIAGRTPQQLRGFRVLDPACGSGSFLLGAYQFLLDYYLSWYIANDPDKHRKAVWWAGEVWRLTTAERKRILLEHIYGVDIDRQAVEVTKLSLLLKVLETETRESLGHQLTLLHEEAKERALPNLDRNIKCGNSLIGPDYFSGQLMPNDDELKRVNPFDWAKEFPEAMRAGGFDCVIGNPPYNAALSDGMESYLQQKYEGVKAGRQDTAAIFVEAGLHLAKGYVMYLLPYRLISRKRNHGPFQEWLYHHCHIQQVIYIGKIDDIGANDEFMMVRLSNTKNPSQQNMLIAPRVLKSDIEKFSISFDTLPQSKWGPPNYEMNVRLGYFNQDLLGKIKSVSINLGDIAESRDGIVPFIRDRLVSNYKKDKRYKPLLGIRGNYRLGRYQFSWGGTYICYDIEEAKKYIKDKSELRKVQLRDESIFLQTEKILTSQDSITVKGTLDTERFYTTNSIHTTYLKSETTGYNIRFILGLLNSRLLNYYHQSLVLKGQDLHPQILVTNLPKLPIRIVNFSDSSDKAQHDLMVKLVEQMLDLHKRLAASQSAGERERLQRLIDSTDQNIDALVYELYGLTPEEIAIVEGRAT